MKQFKLKKDKWYFQSLRETKSVQELENWAVEISWYASTKDKDRWWDVVEPKAFASALERYMTNPIVLLQHKTDKPIGIVEEANIDNEGLYIKAKISQNTDGVIDLIKDGVLRAFSIWYSVRDYDTDVRELPDGSYDYTNIIKDLELYEISVVSVPMNPYALSKSVEDLLEVEEKEDEDETVSSEEEVSEETEEVEKDEVSSEEGVEEAEEKVEEEKKEAEVEKEELPNEEVEAEEIIEEWGDKIDQEYTAEEMEDWSVAVEVKEAEAENLDEKDGDLDENLDENEEEVVAEEPKEADENSEIEETEVEASSENDSETGSDEDEVVETHDEEIVETKSMEEPSKKQFDFDSKIEELSKSFDEKLSAKEEKIKSLESKVERMTKLFAESLDTIENLTTAVKNTPVNSGLAYKRPLKKWYSSIAEGIKNLYNS